MPQPESRPRLITKIHFGQIDLSCWEVVAVPCVRLRDLLDSLRLQGLLLANPGTGELLAVFLAKYLFRRKFRVVLFDLILRRPYDLRSRLLAPLKRLMLRAVDAVLCIHRDLSGYSRHYQLNPRKCFYVPFKPNNADFADSVEVVDGDYILSCGASHRDFNTLLRAVALLDYPLRVILSDANIRQHSALYDERLVSPQVQRIRDHVSREEWNHLIANSRFVVIPIMAGTLQPAGISVYLEAMALGKPVIVTAGSSTEGILDESLAVMVPAGDELALCRAIVGLWGDSECRRLLGENGRHYAWGLGNNARLVSDIEQFMQRYLEGRVADRESLAGQDIQEE